MFAASFAGMQQHVFHNRVGAFAVLYDLAEIVLQERSQFIDFLVDLIGERDLFHHFIELVRELNRKCREIVDEIERVLDLMRDAGGELTE